MSAFIGSRRLAIAGATAGAFAAPSLYAQASRVPDQAPDSVPRMVMDSLTAPANVLTNAPSLPGKWLRNTLYVMFKHNATLAQRQAAVDLVRGEVVGGSPLGGLERFYVVRIPYVLAPGDSVSGPALRAEKALKALPSVDMVSPGNMNKPVIYRQTPK